MTLTTLACPSAILISKEVLTTAGTYNRTPPNGASYVLLKAVGASGGASIPRPDLATAVSGSGGLVKGLSPCVSTDTLVAVVGAGGVASDINGYATSYDPGDGGSSSVSINGVGWMFTFVAAAYNLVRLPKLLAGAT